MVAPIGFGGISEQDLAELIATKLETSDLKSDDCDALRMYGLDPEALIKAGIRTLDGRPALAIPYFDPRNGLPMRTPTGKEFFRVRFLGDRALRADEKKLPKYVQPSGSGVRAYFPTNLEEGWADVLKDTSVPILITEGELKAAKACQQGFRTIGIGGVDNIQDSDEDQPLLIPDLTIVNWVTRIVYIVFDNDPEPKPRVAAALVKLANLLKDLGARPYATPLPREGDEKVGLDDYLKANAPSELEHLLQPHISAPITNVNQLFEMNKEFVHVEYPGFIVNQNNPSMKYRFQDFTASMAGRMSIELISKPNGKYEKRQVNAGEFWQKWPLHMRASKLVYEPGQDRMITDSMYKYACFNTWSGWGCEPKPGEARLFLQLLQYLFKDAHPDDLVWFLRWLAYPLRYPGAKLKSSVVFYGRYHGTGKSTVAETMSHIYGSNFGRVNSKQLESQFNQELENKQMVLGDEVTTTDKLAISGTLKNMITQTIMTINTKNVKPYDLPDRVNYIFTTNKPDAFILDDTDRRFFIHEIFDSAAPQAFYDEYDAWLRAGGAGEIFHYLLNYDLGDFNPNGHARFTEAKARMTELSRHDIGNTVREGLDTPDLVFCDESGFAHPYDLITASEIKAYLDPEDKILRGKARTIGIEMTSAGFRQVCNGTPVLVPGRKNSRYYAIRNRDKWLTATREEVIAHFGTPRKKKGAKY